MADAFELRIDGVDIPAPTGYGYNEADFVANSTRNANGFASWDEVRKNVGSINLTWEKLEGVRLAQIISTTRNKKKFNVHFFNTLTGKFETRIFYSGDRASELSRFISASTYWASLTVPFVEV